MPTILKVDERLIVEAVKAGGHKTKQAAVNAAVAVRHNLRVFTTDTDFDFYTQHVPVRLHRFRGHP